jgi:hypothetical protein
MLHRLIRPTVAVAVIVALGLGAAACTRSAGVVEHGTAVIALQRLGVTLDPADVTCTGDDTVTVGQIPYGAERCRNGSAAPFWVLTNYRGSTAQGIAYVPMDQAHRVHFGSGYFAVSVNWQQTDGTWAPQGSPTVTPVHETPMPTPPPVPSAGS